MSLTSAPRPRGDCDDLVRGLMPTARRIARSYHAPHQQEDLEQVAYLALVKAARRYRPPRAAPPAPAAPPHPPPPPKEGGPRAGRLRGAGQAPPPLPPRARQLVSVLRHPDHLRRAQAPLPRPRLGRARPAPAPGA